MRTIVNISIPQEMADAVEKAMKQKRFSTKSEFFRALVRLWLEGQLAGELGESRKELRNGKGRLLRSLRELR